MPFDINLPDYTFPTPVKILMIRGTYTDSPIDTTIDEKLIRNLPGAKSKIVKPTSRRELIDALDENEFDILIFAVHSSTLDDGSDANILLTDTLIITIDQIQNEIRNALNSINHPLILAIFNSCDGLGIDSRLTSLRIKIPYLIAMKERITDPIAHRFLELFLRYFVKKRMSLERAYKQAQNGLHPLFPGADFLPILCLKQAMMPDLFWPVNIAIFISQLWRNKIARYFGLGIIVLIFIVLGYVLDKYFQDQILVTQDFCKPEKLDMISCGKNPLLDNTPQSEKWFGIKAFETKNYGEAVNRLNSAFDQEQKSLKIASEQEQDEYKKNDEYIKHYETGIFLENAKALQLKKAKDNLQIFPVAVVIPTIDPNENKKEIYSISKAILQGVYNQQEYFNKNNTNNKLLVVIANDYNNAGQTGQNVAKELVERKVLAVIGLYSSRVAYYTKNRYKDNQIVLISYTATATRTDNPNNQKEPYDLTKNSDFFFRVCSTNKGIVEALDKVFHHQGYNSLRLFYNSEDIFSGSFGDEFKKHWRYQNKYQDKEIIPIGNLGNIDIKGEARKKGIDDKLKDAEKQKIGIVLCPGAYTQGPNRDTSQKDVENAQYILEKYGDEQYREKVLIGGCNVITTYGDYIKEVGNLKNIVVGVPWFYDPNNRTDKFDIWKSKWEEQKVNFQTDSFMRMVLAQDATMVLTEALSRLSLSLNRKPSSIELQKYLADSYLADSKDKFQGITGEISFKGSDRFLDTSKVITPKCEQRECKDWNGDWEILL